MLLLILVTSCISAEHYHIVPKDSTSQCQNYSAGTCFTLAEFALNITHLDVSNHLTLSFLPGEHLLMRRLTITGPQNITLTGQPSLNSRMYTIKCQGTSGFEFGDIQSLNIAYLEFTGCGNVSYGGAISINRVENFLVNGCHFIDNHVTLYGGAVLVNNTTTMNIEASIFINNSASALGNETYAGGAICVVNGSVFTINSIYMNNSAYVGGVIYVDSGNVYSTSDQYRDNSAEIGGAINVNSGNVSSISDQYTNNCVGIAGGAISVYSGDISSTSDQYINNSAETGGAIYVYSANIFSTSDQYINNSADLLGGAIYVYSGNVSSISDQYKNNCVGIAGGAIFVYSGDISSTSDQYINNSAETGGAIYVYSGDISSASDQYINNSAETGGAIYVYSGNVSSISDQYTNNCVGIAGGAIFVYSGDISSTSDQYINNSAETGGAIYVYSGDISSTSDQYINNSAETGGAIYVYSGDISSASDQYINNSAETGGAIFVYSGNVTSASDQYINNSAQTGGAIYFNSGNVTSTSDQYINNSAYGGGAIYVYSGNISSTSDYYINNSAAYGGAIYVLSSNISSTRDHYIHNSADSGGAIYMDSGSCNLCNDSFNINRAATGAVIYKTGGTLEIGKTNITSNFANNKSTLFLKSVTLMIVEGVNFMNNHGSLYVSSTQVQINGAAVFMNNSGDFGGAITATQQSQIIFNTRTASMLTICNNTATYGGGIYLTQSNLHVIHPFELTDNKAYKYGGGIYASRSEIEFKSEQTKTLQITNNTALNGGALCAIASTIQISKYFVDYNSNTAIMNGGAMYLGQNSKIQLLKNEPDYVQNDNLHIRLDFTSNSAEKGGAIYIAHNSNDRVVCQGADREVNQAECFIQTLRTYGQVLDTNYTFINTFFTNNTARQSGSDIYGGLLDRCTTAPGAELLSYFDVIQYGFDYIKATTQIEQIIDYSQYAKSHPDYLIKNITKPDVMGLISSNGILKFCSDNHVVSPNHSHPIVLIHKGELFKFSIVVVDQVGNPVNATVSSSLSSESGNGHFKGGQVEQQVGNQCTELEYNVYSQDSLATFHLHLYAEGPCGNNIEVSKITLNLIFLPCQCPVGFQPSSSQTECICECDRRLMQHKITSCFAKTGTIQVETNIWIGVTNSTNGTGFVIHDCPFDYCVQKPVNISLSSPDSVDEQCAYNRTENLCGMCKDLSLVFGSSRCQECSSYYIFLFIPFALAGIALVTVILLLNMTVATGTIHGLIFYANILTANLSLFLPFANPNFLTVFISWLNLDLGVETCFYNGMDSYGKFLLQLAFPIYVFVLIGTIIVLCEVSKKFATLLGNRNPVAALCTLILLSYSKLTRTIITALQFTYLDCPNGSREIVWLYDANVLYFKVSHIPRFIAAFIIIILGAIYIILLLFGQWFPHCSDRKFMKWAKNTKYNAFIDAYHAPFTPRHRYWMGLLLFALTTHNIVAAMSADSPAPILSAGCISVGLILLKLLNTRIYKNRLQDSLETLFLTNIVILTVATRESSGNQFALANTSMAISFILFLIILSYHFYNYILKGTRVWARVTQLRQQIVHHRDRHREFDLVPLENEDNVQHDPVREMQPLYTDDTDTGPIDLPHHYDPPVIVPAVRYDQLREPDLDILDPITTDDYRQLNQPPAPRPRQVPTTTEIDFVRPHRNVDSVNYPYIV